jgi:hypothetical protein
MAHYAEIDTNDIVLRVLVVNNEQEQDEHGNDDEAKGVAYLQSLFGANTRWVRTSYHGNTRKRYAGAGMKYDAALDAFIPSQPYPSWTLNSATADWDAPTPKPVSEDNFYTWDEATLSWVAHPNTAKDAKP